jgi:RNA polymerase sigma-70 factor (ECF subfamily)
MQEAFAAALLQWPSHGIPHNPCAWLISVGRFGAIDLLRKQARFQSLLPQLASDSDRQQSIRNEIDDAEIDDDTLRLIFTCCHPSLSTAANMALTLREVCGLSNEEIARAFLSTTPTVAQRIVRAKAKIRDAGIPYRIPSLDDLPERLDAVRRVIYLLFNEGYSATSGDTLTRPHLCREAIRLARLLRDLMPDLETSGLLALMLLHESRRQARTDEQGDIILLGEQERSLWNRELISEAFGALAFEADPHPPGVYWLQGAIAAVHATASSTEQTDWSRIVALYDRLTALDASPVISLNRAVAVAMRDGPVAGLALLDGLRAEGALEDYYLLHSSRAELLRRAGQTEEARAAYERALQLTCQGAEQRFLRRQRDSLTS